MSERYRREPPEKYRCVRDTWHFCTNCSAWPKGDFEESPERPPEEYVCGECKIRYEAFDCDQ